MKTSETPVPSSKADEDGTGTGSGSSTGPKDPTTRKETVDPSKGRR